MSWLIRIFKLLLWTVFLLLSAIASFAVFSNAQHLLFTLSHTVFEGRLGPSIDEYLIYHNREVKVGEAKPWPESYTQSKMSAEEKAYHQQYGTAAFLVIKSDTIRYEYYDKDHQINSLTNSWSMAKSIISLLIGIAIEDGLIENEQVLLSEYFEQYQGSGISIEHLLSMSSGINFDEHYLNPFAHSARSLYGKDIVKLNNRYKPVTKPGIIFDYQGGNTILLGMILRKVTGQTVSEYASEKLWKPMGAEHPALWSLDHKDGMERVFCCFNATARDFARIGQLLLNKGEWSGQQLVAESYIKKATAAADLKELDGSANQRYGYQWWVLQMDKYEGYYARGIQGQYIVVLPQEEMVVVRLGDSRPAERVQGHVVDMLYYIDIARRLCQP